MEHRAAVLINILEAKMNLVKVERTNLHGAVDAYVDKVTETAQEAIKAGDQDVGTIRDMSTKMEATLEYLVGLSMEFEGDTAGQSSTVSDHQMLPSASVLDETTSLSSPTAYSLYHQLKNSESADIVELQNRVKTVEAAIATCRHEASQNTAQHEDEMKENKMLYHTLEERMGKYENLISELTEKQFTAFEENAERTKKLEAQNNDQGERLKAAEHQLQDFERNRTASEEEQDRRLSDFEDKIKQNQKELVKKVKGIKADILDGFQQKLDQITEAQTEVQEKQDGRLSELENELSELQSQHADLMKRVSSKKEAVGKRITDLENKVANDQSRFHNLSDDVEKLKTQYSKGQQSSKLNSVKEQLEQLTSHLTTVEENVQEDIKQLKETSVELKSNLDLFASKEDLCDVMKISKTLSNSVDGLISKGDATEMFVKGSLSFREKEENKRMELEDRILVVEESRRKDLESYSRNLEEVESQYKEVCQIVDNRVTPLRRLQRLLHEYHQSVEKREELSSRLDQAMEQIKGITSKVDSVVAWAQHNGTGFTAYFPRKISVPNIDAVVTDFSDVYYNLGSHYNPATGIFTAPCDGVFLTSVTLRQCGKGKVDVHIVHRKTACRPLCKAATHADKTSCCGVAVVKLTAGDQLYVKVQASEGEVTLSSYSSFSCVKVA